MKFKKKVNLIINNEFNRKLIFIKYIFTFLIFRLLI